MGTTLKRPSFRQTGASVTLDALRGAAALLVVLDHCKNLFFVDCAAATKMSAHPHLVSFFYGVASAGPQAVVIFLVLSGYLVGGSVLRATQADRWSWKGYLTQRLVRLWLVLLPALALCAGWDAARVGLTSSAAYTGSGGFASALAGTGVTWANFWGNVFFLQTLHTPTFGSDRVLWSLAAEFWYYILFPLGFLAVRRATPVWMRCLYGAGLFLVAAFVGRGLLGLFPVWLCGALLAAAKPPRLDWVVRASALALYLPLLGFLTVYHWPWRLFKMDHALGLATMLLLWVLLSAQSRVRENTVWVRVSRSLAGMSYSLYLAHYPMLAFFARWLAPAHWGLQAKTLVAVMGFGALAVLYGYALAACTEWHNDRVRPWVEDHLLRRSAHAFRGDFRARARIVAG